MEAVTMVAEPGDTEFVPIPPLMTFNALTKRVGGYVTTIRLPGDMVMIVDEDGIAKGRPANPAASIASRTAIVGTAVLMDARTFGSLR